MSVEMCSNADLEDHPVLLCVFLSNSYFLIPEEESSISSLRKTSAEYKPGK